MKVLQVNTVSGTGSTGRITSDIYNALKKQGHDCVVAFGRGDGQEGIKTIKIGSNLSVNIHGLFTRITDKHGFYSSMDTKKFIHQIKEYNPDVIHLHNIHGYYINIEELFNYLKKINIPIVWTLHDCWSFTGHCAHFDYIGCSKWKTCCYKCPQKKVYPTSLLIDNSKFNYLKKKELFTSIENMTIVTPSIWLANLVKESFLSKFPVKVINNGIDLDLFKPTQSDFRTKYNIEDKFIILGVAGVWNTKKGLDTFIELSKNLDSKYKIVLVGLSKKQINDLPNNIIGITKTNNIRELAEIYTAANIFVNPSVEETMGLVTVEALACGTPALVYNATAVPEVMADDCGFIIEKNDFQGLKMSIEKVKNYNYFSSLNCIEHSKKYRNSDKYNEYINLYLEIHK